MKIRTASQRNIPTNHKHMNRGQIYEQTMYKQPTDGQTYKSWTNKETNCRQLTPQTNRETNNAQINKNPQTKIKQIMDKKTKMDK